MVSCSRFVWITNFSDHRRVWTADLLHRKLPTELHTKLPNPLGPTLYARDPQFKPSSCSLEFVIQTNFEHNTVAVWNFARSWNISTFHSGIFKYRCPDYVHLWVKFFIQNLVVRVSSRKKTKCFPAAPFFLCFWENVCSSTLVPQNLSCPEKCLAACLHPVTILFAKRSILNIRQCSEYACLNNCSVTCTVTLCLWPYDLMSSSLYPEILSINVNSNIFRHIHVIFRHIQPHCSIFRTACNSCLLVYSVLCHIQNLSILSNRDVFRTVL